MLAVAKNWNNGAKVELSAMLPEAKKAELDKSFAAAAAALLKEGIEVGYSADVKSGFKVGEKNGGYYISFSDESSNTSKQRLWLATGTQIHLSGDS